MGLTTLVILAIVAGLIFDITNGWNDSANAIATVITTRVLSPGVALAMSAGMNFIGAFVSIKVAVTIGAGVVALKPEPASVAIVLAAMIAAASWTAWCTRLGLPVSCSHALVGGLIGSAVFAVGWGVVKGPGLAKIFVALFASPIAGLVLGYLLVVLFTRLSQEMEVTPWQGRKLFGFLQICSAGFMAFEHGKNDAQKVMGVIALALFSAGMLRDDTGAAITNIDKLYIPVWVILLCASAMAFGTAVGGWKVIRTLGTKLTKITTLEGCSAETGAGIVLEFAAETGVPVSTTHTLTGAVVGVGSAKGMRAVKWGIGAKIIYAWIFTLPVTFVLGGALSWFSTLTSPLVMVCMVCGVLAVTFVISARRSRRSAEPVDATPASV